MNLKINGVDKVKANLKSIERQLPFAISKSLNDTAVDVQKMVVNELLPAKFTLRSAWASPGRMFGVNIRFANKTNLRAIVGSRAPWLEIQETGGTKTAQTAKNLSIPQEARPSHASPIPRRLRPRALFKRKGFVIHTEGGLSLLAVRDGDRNKIMYSFKPSAHVRAQLGFAAATRAKANAVYRVHFDKRLKQAIATAK